MEYELMFGWKIEPTDFSLSFFFPFFFGKLGEICVGYYTAFFFLSCGLVPIISN